MTFKELKTGDTLYTLNHTNADLKKGRVLSVVPHSVTPEERSHMPYGSMPDAKVEVTVDIEGQNPTYVLSENQDRNYLGSLAILSSREAALKDLSELQEQSRRIMDSYEQSKQNVEKCEELKSQLDPAHREKMQNEQRFANMEGRIDSLDDKLAKILEIVTKNE